MPAPGAPVWSPQTPLDTGLGFGAGLQAGVPADVPTGTPASLGALPTLPAIIDPVAVEREAIIARDIAQMRSARQGRDVAQAKYEELEKNHIAIRQTTLRQYEIAEKIAEPLRQAHLEYGRIGRYLAAATTEAEKALLLIEYQRLADLIKALETNWKTATDAYQKLLEQTQAAFAQMWDARGEVTQLDITIERLELEVRNLRQVKAGGPAAQSEPPPRPLPTAGDLVETSVPEPAGGERINPPAQPASPVPAGLAGGTPDLMQSASPREWLGLAQDIAEQEARAEQIKGDALAVIEATAVVADVVGKQVGQRFVSYTPGMDGVETGLAAARGFAETFGKRLAEGASLSEAATAGAVDAGISGTISFIGNQAVAGADVLRDRILVLNAVGLSKLSVQQITELGVKGVSFVFVKEGQEITGNLAENVTKKLARMAELQARGWADSAASKPADGAGGAYGSSTVNTPAVNR